MPLDEAMEKSIMREPLISLKARFMLIQRSIKLLGTKEHFMTTFGLKLCQA
eukprot:CAMPEP_0202948304 /NCGR_PEP_ID=MMETSP1395-20130829/13225_1 /ASSEMBLY_ACC=CAM_ASM_000871 /TAXON_ID=5961 /ORGANISM="Blepharisma japonicum, Strain Stock R1072" /LENGTH=50 /DNA_ID=CAMNT_0049650243 /DNA_START=242 /DNA_END=394 /DNA_ORIENTATION=-